MKTTTSNTDFQTFEEIWAYIAEGDKNQRSRAAESRIPICPQILDSLSPVS
ncbi:MAG: hypothetical protein KBC96_13840 [Armatimonadetes bacterium]|nr:hypothetical protein [Armatimonadota bacterium]